MAETTSEPCLTLWFEQGCAKCGRPANLAKPPWEIYLCRTALCPGHNRPTIEIHILGNGKYHGKMWAAFSYHRLDICCAYSQDLDQYGSPWKIFPTAIIPDALQEGVLYYPPPAHSEIGEGDDPIFSSFSCMDARQEGGENDADGEDDRCRG